MPLSFDNFRSPAALARFLLTAAILLALDLATKHYAFAHLLEGMRVSPSGRIEVYSRQPDPQVIPGIIHLHLTVNQGAVFGSFQGFRWMFVAVSIGAIVFLGYLFAGHRERIVQLLLGMLLAGVLGNLYDRLAFGYVRDMIFALPRWPDLFPYIFNVADMLLVCGVAALIVHSLLHPARARKPAADVPVPAPRQKTEPHP